MKNRELLPMRLLAGTCGLLGLLAGSTAGAQSNVTTTAGGTSGYVPKFNSATNIESSSISLSGSNVWISGALTATDGIDSAGTLYVAGTATHSGQLNVNNQLKIGYDANLVIQAQPYGTDPGDLVFLSGAGTEYGRILTGSDGMRFRANSGRWNDIFIKNSNGYVGILNGSPAYPLDVAGNGNFSGSLRIGGYFLKAPSAQSWPNSPFVVYDWEDQPMLYLFEVNGGTNMFEVRVGGDLYVDGKTSTGSFVDRTPYPENVGQAYASVLSMSPLPEGQYDANDPSKQLDHSTLDPFIADGTPDEPARNLSATVSAQNEVIKDLITRINALEARVAVCQP